MPYYSPSDFQREFNVSRETVEAMDAYRDLLLRWNAKINLISRATEKDIWSRHFRDSAQLWHLRPEKIKSWLDMGSGAGFPGLVVGILARDQAADVKITLVESDSRKCAFLRTVAQQLKIDIGLFDARIEDLAPQNSDVISARALAPLPALLAFAQKHRRGNGICLFPKGRTVHNEIRASRKVWNFAADIEPSLTDPSSCIVRIGAFSRV